jgi:LytS/YehU family sensor histidine kinase
MGLASYLNYFIWLPRFLKHKNLLRYIAEFIIPFAIIVFVHLQLKRWIYMDIIQNGRVFLNSAKFVIQLTASTLFIVIFVGMLRFVEDWFTMEARKKEIENDRLSAELRFLKSQINPHFLFNTLNNLYYLATVNSPNTTTVIEKLSQMMRYMLYDSNHAMVPLNKELEYMENYISLEKLRWDNQIPVKFEIIGDLSNVKIVPLIFITFLENAFKHGVSNSYADSFVDVEIKIEDSKIEYHVKNSKLPKDANKEKSGIGLQNVKRRLQLTYPEKFILSQSETEKVYDIKLTIDLS